MRHRIWTWIRLHPYASTTICGVLLMVWPIPYLMFIQLARHQFRNGVLSRGVISWFIDAQYELSLHHTWPVAAASLIVGVTIIVISLAEKTRAMCR
jgi:hypothetical protein